MISAAYWECVRRASRTSDGRRISGHALQSKVAFTDSDTGRIYYVDICSHCGHASVSWTPVDGPINLTEHYEQVRRVGDR